MQNNFRELEALVFFDLWIPDSGLRIQDSGFRFQIPASGFGFRIPVSGFLVLGLPLINHQYKITILEFEK